MKTFCWMRTETRGETGVAFGVLAPVRADSSLYKKWSGGSVGERRPALVRFFGRAKGLEDGVSFIICRGKRYRVLEYRPLAVNGRAVTGDALLREE